MYIKPFIGLIFGLCFMVSCKLQPTYNPFDDQFEISTRQLVRDGCDTVMVSCGFFNMVYPEGKLRSFYEFFGDEKKVLGKGFLYFIDTIEAQRYWFQNGEEQLIDSIMKLPIDQGELNKALAPFDCRVLGRSKKNDDDDVVLFHKVSNTSDTLYADVFWDKPNSLKEPWKFVRILHYSRGSK